MSKDRQVFKVIVAGQEYEIPTTMSIIVAAEEASGVSFFEAMAENRIGGIVQGAIFAHLRNAGVDEVGEKALSYDAVGTACNFRETFGNQLAFMRAMAPDVDGAKTQQSDGDSKNAVAEDPANDSTGERSSATPTDSSS